MCGIFLQALAGQEASSAPCLGANLERVRRRGPDAFAVKYHSTNLHDGRAVRLAFASSVLHLRGPNIARQPLSSDQFILQWNGEIYPVAGGPFEISKDENDTQVLFRSLHECTSLEDVVQLLGSIEGEFAFILFSIKEKVLLYGRDRFGRRSLLQRGSPEGDYFELASVAPCTEKTSSSVGEWSEVAAVGIHSFSLDKTFGEVADPQSTIKRWSSLPTSAGPFTITDRVAIRASEADDAVAGLLPETIAAFDDAFKRRLENVHPSSRDAAVAILFSGGIDSIIMAVMCHRNFFDGCPIDLINVAFYNERFVSGLAGLRSPSDGLNCKGSDRNGRGAGDGDDPYEAVPDRISGRAGVHHLARLFPTRPWRFIAVNVTREEYSQWRPHVISLMRPACTVMDLSIAIALWFAARGEGECASGGCKSKAKVLLVGMGADEQYGGYGRHRTAFERGSAPPLCQHEDGCGEPDERWALVREEMQMELDRISSRNLGRDDRCISDHGKEARFPFLDERLVAYSCRLPLNAKVDFSLPRGRGEKVILRRMASLFGLPDSVALLPKRAIQFGAKTAKMADSHERGDTAVTGEMLAPSAPCSGRVPSHLPPT